MSCVCGHAEEEHEDGFFQPCTECPLDSEGVPTCGDYEDDGDDDDD